jgi:hypothetical protein
MSAARHDVEPHMYPMVIREMIRHENDLTNHRIMWLLIAQGLFATAYVGAGMARASTVIILAPAAVLVTLSTFVILYKSYHARGYLDFLGAAAKRGALPEERLPLLGWPATRIKNWRKDLWACPWLKTSGDLLEPYFFLPVIIIVPWLFVLLQYLLPIGTAMVLALAAALTVLLLAGFCILWVRAQQGCEREL